MKKILGILLVVISLNVYSQDFYPLTGEGKHWVVALPDEWGIGYYEELWEYYMSGDTVINNLSYKKVYYRTLIIPESMLPPYEAAEDYWLYGVIRSDEPNRKVYAINFLYDVNDCIANEEYLMYDFSLNPGDIPDFCTFFNVSDDYIQAVEEDYVFNEISRIYTSAYGYQYFEGIGSMNGLFELIFIPVKNNSYIPYPSLIYYCPTNDCDVILKNNTIFRINKLNTYPNPGKSQIAFQLPIANKESILQIRDIYGKAIKELPLIKEQTQIVWNCSNIASGVYFYQTEIGDVVYRGKIVVQH